MLGQKAIDHRLETWEIWEPKYEETIFPIPGLKSIAHSA
jgi:hypothetical protein